MLVTNYGIKVPFEDSYLWVCKDSKDLDLQPLLFDTIEEALKSAELWGPLAKVQKYEVG